MPTRDNPLILAAVELFRETFEGSRPSFGAVAGGRVNLIGEHTDYSQGYCLPIVIGLSTVCVISKGKDPKFCRVVSRESDGGVESFVRGAPPTGEVRWSTFVAGCAAQYPGDGTFDAAFASTVPLGGGLSSSAALDVAFSAALERLENIRNITPEDRALRCVRADHEYPKVPCGIMDQFVVSCAKSKHALLIDCGTSTAEPIPFDEPDLALLVINTNVAHSHASGAYQARVRECAEAAKLLGLPNLRAFDGTLAELSSRIADPVVLSRARHVVTENARCLSAAQAAKARDWQQFGLLMSESHASLRDDFAVSCPELDHVVDVAKACDRVLGARMTGGGFGGCAIVLVPAGEPARMVLERIESEYPKAFEGRKPTTYVFDRAGSGVRSFEL